MPFWFNWVELPGVCLLTRFASGRYASTWNTDRIKNISKTTDKANVCRCNSICISPAEGDAVFRHGTTTPGAVPTYQRGRCVEFCDVPRSLSSPHAWHSVDVATWVFLRYAWLYTRVIQQVVLDKQSRGLSIIVEWMKKATWPHTILCPQESVALCTALPVPMEICRHVRFGEGGRATG